MGSVKEGLHSGIEAISRSAVCSLEKKYIKSKSEPEKKEYLDVILKDCLTSPSIYCVDETLQLLTRVEMPPYQTLQAIIMVIAQLPEETLFSASTAIVSHVAKLVKIDSEFELEGFIGRIANLRPSLLPILALACRSRENIGIPVELVRLCLGAKKQQGIFLFRNDVLNELLCGPESFDKEITYTIVQSLRTFSVQQLSDIPWVAHLCSELVFGRQLPSSILRQLLVFIIDLATEELLLKRSIIPLLQPMKLILNIPNIDFGDLFVALRLGYCLLLSQTSKIRKELMNLIQSTLHFLPKSFTRFLILPLSQASCWTPATLQDQAKQLLRLINNNLQLRSEHVENFNSELFSFTSEAPSVYTETFSRILSNLNNFYQKETDVVMHWDILQEGLKKSLERDKMLPAQVKGRTSTLCFYFLAPFVFLPPAKFTNRAHFKNWIASLFSMLPVDFTGNLLSWILQGNHYEVMSADFPSSQILYSLNASIELCSVTPVLISPVLRILSPLYEIESARASYLRLLLSLSLSSQKVTPVLINAIRKLSTQEDKEVQMALALTILDLAVKAPNEAIKTVSMLSRLLSVPDQSPAIIKVLLKSLTTLCNQDFIDFRTAWNVIKRRQSADRRTMVCAELCKFLTSGITLIDEIDAESKSNQPSESANPSAMSHAPSKPQLPDQATPGHAKEGDRKDEEEEEEEEEEEDEEEDEEEEEEDEEEDAEEFLKEIINFLWDLSKSNEFEVRTNAIEAIVRFAIECPRLVEHLNFKSFVKFLGTKGQESAGPAGNKLVLYALEPELKLHMRGNASGWTSIPSPYSQFLKLGESLRDSYTKGVSAAVAHGYALGLLYSYLPQEPAKNPKSELGLALLQARDYKVISKELINDMRATDYFSYLLMFNAWQQFSSRAANVFSKAEYEKLLAKFKGKVETIDELRAKKNATTKIINGALSVVSENKNLSPAAYVNSIIYLATLCLAVPATGNEILQTVITKCDQEIKSDLVHRWVWLAAMGIVSSKLLQNDSGRICTLGDFLLIEMLKKDSGNEMECFGAALGLVYIVNRFSEVPSVTVWIKELVSSTINAVLSPSRTEKIGTWNIDGAILFLGLVSQHISNELLLEVYRQIRNWITVLSSGAPLMCQIRAACIIASPVGLSCLRANLITVEAFFSFLRLLDGLSDDDGLDPNAQSLLAVSIGSLMQGCACMGVSMPEREIIEYTKRCSRFIRSSHRDLQIGGAVGFANLLGASLIAPTVPGEGNQQYLAPGLVSALRNVPFAEIQQALEASLCDTMEPNRARWSAIVLGSLARPLLPSADFYSASNLPPPGTLSRQVIDLILGKFGEGDSHITEKYDLDSATAALECFISISSKYIPKLPWSTILQKAMKCYSCEETRIIAFRFAIAHQSVPSVAYVLADWLEVSTFQTLPYAAQLIGVQSVHIILVHYSSEKSSHIAARLEGFVRETGKAELMKSLYSSFSQILLAIDKPDAAFHSAIIDCLTKAFRALPPVLLEGVLDESTLELMRSMCSPVAAKILLYIDGKIEDLSYEEGRNIFALACDLVLQKYAEVGLLLRLRSWLLAIETLEESIFTSADLLVRTLCSCSSVTMWSEWLLDCLDATTMLVNPYAALCIAECLLYRLGGNSLGYLLNVGRVRKVGKSGGSFIPLFVIPACLAVGLKFQEALRGRLTRMKSSSHKDVKSVAVSALQMFVSF